LFFCTLNREKIGGMSKVSVYCTTITDDNGYLLGASTTGVIYIWPFQRIYVQFSRETSVHHLTIARIHPTDDVIRVNRLHRHQHECSTRSIEMFKPIATVKLCDECLYYIQYVKDATEPSIVWYSAALTHESSDVVLLSPRSSQSNGLTSSSKSRRNPKKLPPPRGRSPSNLELTPASTPSR
jgi:hypothetical protein